MNEEKTDTKRVAAFSFVSGGIGYVVLEDNNLMDWGIYGVENKDLASPLKRIDDLLGSIEPDEVILYDLDDPKLRKGFTARCFAILLLYEMKQQGREPISICRCMVANRFPEFSNKSELAIHIADLYPELRDDLPPKRKPWQSQDRRMAIFEAMAMVMAM